MDRRSVAFAAVVVGCARPVPPPPPPENRFPNDVVELEWRARMDDGDREWVTLVVDGKPFVLGMAGGPDDDANTEPDGCTSERWQKDPSQQVFFCGAASRWYTVALDRDLLVATRWDEWLEQQPRETHTVVLRLPVRGSQLRVVPYPTRR